MNLVLLGAPGSGKGTQAQRLAESLGLVHVASGDLFRHHLNQHTELGQVVQDYLARGALVPDDITIAMIRERITQPDALAGVLLDGFPRTLDQARALETLMAELGRDIAGAIYLEVPDEALVRRIAGRQICRVCQVPFHRDFHPFLVCPSDRCHGEHLYQRDDDLPETVRARIATFHRLTEPAIEFYRRAGILSTVAGEGPVAEVAERLREAIGALSVRTVSPPGRA